MVPVSSGYDESLSQLIKFHAVGEVAASHTHNFIFYSGRHFGPSMCRNISEFSAEGRLAKMDNIQTDDSGRTKICGARFEEGIKINTLLSCEEN